MNSSIRKLYNFCLLISSISQEKGTQKNVFFTDGVQCINPHTYSMVVFEYPMGYHIREVRFALTVMMPLTSVSWKEAFRYLWKIGRL